MSEIIYEADGTYTGTNDMSGTWSIENGKLRKRD